MASKPGSFSKMTPNNYMKFNSELYQKLEASKIPPPSVDLTKEYTFFNNVAVDKVVSGYDQFFAYTKTFPIFDERKLKDNRAYQQDIWDRIYEQEKPKAVPATTSMNYGRRPKYDVVRGHERQNQMGNFYNKSGAGARGTSDKYLDNFTLMSFLI